MTKRPAKKVKTLAPPVPPPAQEETPAHVAEAQRWLAKLGQPYHDIEAMINAWHGVVARVSGGVVTMLVKKNLRRHDLRVYAIVLRKVADEMEEKANGE
jgi:hypothetical protein